MKISNDHKKIDFEKAFDSVPAKFGSKRFQKSNAVVVFSETFSEGDIVNPKGFIKLDTTSDIIEY